MSLVGKNIKEGSNLSYVCAILLAVASVATGCMVLQFMEVVSLS